MAAAVATRAVNIVSSAKLFLYSPSHPPLPFARRPLLLFLLSPLLSPASPSSSRFTPIRCCQSRSGDSSLPLKHDSNFRDRLLTKMAPLFPGCDHEHWLILMDKPGGQGATKQQMIDCYVQTLATVVGRYVVSLAIEKLKGFNVEEGVFGFYSMGRILQMHGRVVVILGLQSNFVLSDPKN